MLLRPLTGLLSHNLNVLQAHRCRQCGSTGFQSRTCCRRRHSRVRGEPQIWKVPFGLSRASRDEGAGVVSRNRSVKGSKPSRVVSWSDFARAMTASTKAAPTKIARLRFCQGHPLRPSGGLVPLPRSFLVPRALTPECEGGTSRKSRESREEFCGKGELRMYGMCAFLDPACLARFLRAAPPFSRN